MSLRRQSLLVPKAHALSRERRRVEKETEFMDTIVLHGGPQRFYTDDLYKKLHWYYFSYYLRPLQTVQSCRYWRDI